MIGEDHLNHCCIRNLHPRSIPQLRSLPRQAPAATATERKIITAYVLQTKVHQCHRTFPFHSHVDSLPTIFFPTFLLTDNMSQNPPPPPRNIFHVGTPPKKICLSLWGCKTTPRDVAWEQGKAIPGAVATVRSKTFSLACPMLHQICNEPARWLLQGNSQRHPVCRVNTWPRTSGGGGLPPLPP